MGAKSFNAFNTNNIDKNEKLAENLKEALNSQQIDPHIIKKDNLNEGTGDDDTGKMKQSF